MEQKGRVHLANSDNLGYAYIEDSETQKHVRANEALRLIDGFSRATSVKDKDLSTPPGSPSNGDSYIVGASPTGDWASQANSIAFYTESAWFFIAPIAGNMAFVQDENAWYEYDGTNWVSDGGAVVSPFGAFIRPAIVEEELTGLSGASVDTNVSLIPTRSIILGVSVKVSTAITGAASFDVGDGSTVDRYGGSIGIALNSENIGVVGPFAIYSAGFVRLTANGSNFTAGAVKVSAQILTFGAPV